MDDFRIMKQIMIYFAGACADQGARVRVAASLFTVVHGVHDRSKNDHNPVGR